MINHRLVTSALILALICCLVFSLAAIVGMVFYAG